MSYKNLNEAEIAAIVDLIKQQHPYREIIKKFPALKSTSAITRIKREYIDNQKIMPRIMSERTRRKISKHAQQSYIAKNSEIIVDGYINVLKGFENNILNLERIQKLHEQGCPEIIKELENLKNEVAKFNSAYKPDSNQVNETFKEITKTLRKVNNLFLHSRMRIKAIAELRRQFETLMKLRIDVEVLSEIGKMFEALIMACEVLGDADYFKFKNEALSLHEATAGWFEKYEGCSEENKDKQG